ncbi:GNAT family N-acetyltransferase [Sedimentimonas flavescens]|uniref:GNAT family N-acetyltransferase n=1 Tax=Sedimentimonas flavescens TaxID=2851012 RepID=A0ABT2ZY65_9RHOB|nr:GNAT family N-acetyltransferase [Sedimentimonas flavescens]MCV2878469.1 GNAT family N-acetyltransferase [Sedimentimonas flavescens]
MENLAIVDTKLGPLAWGHEVDALGGGALQQHWTYGEIAALKGRRVRRCEVLIGSQRIAMAQVIGRGGFWLLGRGPVLAPGVSVRPVLRALARALSGALIATPEVACEGWGLVPLVTPRHHAIWDLVPDAGTLRAGLAGKWRNRLAVAERSALRVEIDRAPDWLIAAEAAQRRARGYRGLPGDCALTWGRAETGGLLALKATLRGAPIAGMIFLRHGAMASYHIGWTGPEGRSHHAHNLLLWRAAEILRGQGVQSLDLGDVNSEEGAGLMRFKLGTGAVARALGATCLVIPGQARLARS